MSRQLELEIPPTLTDREARVVIEILEEVIDVLARQLDRRADHERAFHEDWSTPEWMDEESSNEQ